MMSILLSLNLTLSAIFIMMNNPVSLGAILLMQTMVVSLITSMQMYSFWMSYILFLIMIGGMLILFTYMTSIASNEKFYMSTNKMIMSTTTMIILIIISLLMDNSMMYQIFKNNDISSMINTIQMIDENQITINKIYNKPNNLITILLINYLLLTLIAVVKITNVKYGPIRQKF